MSRASVIATTGSVLTTVAQRVEGAAFLDGPADLLARAWAPLARRSRSLLSGSWLGHPLHPALVAGPLGFFSAATAMDALGQPEAARKLVGAGLLASGPTALTGLSDWLDTSGAERRVGLAHLALNSLAVGLYAASYRRRRAGRQPSGMALAGAGAAVMGASAWLGGHLAYGLGVGVDTNAFSAGAVDWTEVEGRPAEDGSPMPTSVGSTALVASRQGDRVCVLADRCSHRGGPLSEGTVRGGTITCPWHGSRFDLATGKVVSGPAVVAQPVYEAEEVAGRLRVRRNEQRTLRTNPARP